jgi:hypothetical protein
VAEEPDTPGETVTTAPCGCGVGEQPTTQINARRAAQGR